MVLGELLGSCGTMLVIVDCTEYSYYFTVKYCIDHFIVKSLCFTAFYHGKILYLEFGCERKPTFCRNTINHSQILMCLNRNALCALCICRNLTFFF